MSLKSIRIKGAPRAQFAGYQRRYPPRSALSSSPGLSGSGKSTLAFDTIYAEGQRKYWSNRSPAYARQFLEQLQKPEPGRKSKDCRRRLPSRQRIGLEQSQIDRGHDHGKFMITSAVLFARVGTPHCWGLRPAKISSQTRRSQIVDAVMSNPPGSKDHDPRPADPQPEGRAFARTFGAIQQAGISCGPRGLMGKILELTNPNAAARHW